MPPWFGFSPNRSTTVPLAHQIKEHRNGYPYERHED
jgi:hypothetical protein